WPGATWLKVNNVYTTSGIAYQPILNASSISPPMPVFLVEAVYENEHGVTNQQLRAQSYWTLLSGGFGHLFGNCPIWGFGFATGFCSSTNWKGQLNGAGSVNMQHFGELFNSRHWHTLVPDKLHSALTGGYGSFGQSNYAAAAYAVDGSSIIAYLPTSRTITVSGTSLSGSTMMAWWYNPSTGMATQIGAFPTTGTRNFTPPGSGDWVLVLDSTTFSFPPPGSK
ncbi:MAG TPA: putative collagen-binding domain-containing protein, partial [Nitrospiraceae bacterium]|nr:putative collagen-binding domain-containing protein [Nitrospiraceae bacterium]